jgi:hypothetical protein
MKIDLRQLKKIFLSFTQLTIFIVVNIFYVTKKNLIIWVLIQFQKKIHRKNRTLEPYKRLQDHFRALIIHLIILPIMPQFRVK